jgi:glutaminase
VRQRFAAGEVILRKGDPAEAVYLLTSGQVSVTVHLPNGLVTRLSTISPGMAFGELAVIDRSGRTADVQADTAVECWALSATELDHLGECAPTIKVRLLENLLRSVYRMVGRLNHEVATLAR